MQSFADAETVKKIITELYPDAQKVEFVEHGYDNLVVLVDKKYAVKFPRNNYAYLRDEYEKLILLDLASLQDITIPKILGEGQNPPYVVSSFVDGVHVSQDEINYWSLEEQKHLAQQLAKFAFSMHSLLSTQRALEDQKKIGLDDFHGYEYILSQFNFSTEKQIQIAKDYYQKWKDLKYSTPNVVVHDDLQTNNLLFVGKKLSGVIDFGDTSIGVPEQELRQLYRINEKILEEAVKEYEKLSGYKLNYEAVKIWGVIQELSAYSDRLMKKEFDSAPFLRSTKNLQKWLPEGNWKINK